MPKAKRIETEEMLRMMKVLEAQLAERKKEEAAEAPVHKPSRQPAAAAPRRKLEKKEEEMLLAVAKASLQQFGTLVPPKEALYGVLEAECPQCGHKGKVATDFGFKTYKGVVKPQSWCRWCRNSPRSHPGRQR